MSEDFAPIEQLAGNLLQSLSAPERRSLLRKLARALRATQSERIGRQHNPDGSAYVARRPRRELKPGNFAVKFLYPKGDANARLVFMKSWVRQGPLLTGFDAEAGAIRSFFWDKVDRFLPVEPEDQNKAAGKLRRRGNIRRQAMFRKLRSGRFLRSGATDSEAWIGFTGRASMIASIHQDGKMDAPKLGGRQIRYAQRGLLGLTERERGLAIDMLLDHVASR
ncbi:phage virion morphogenesis protein [Sphingomonas sanguinis]|uniref:phage virion morphogenesis protein n=1 Tax=Sphingomonas sanguinis TaxID=33051 RepID=UPI001C59D8E7|nr:phage virion morphogenesis protein [Sphingomonas sanguinis]QXT36844.1 phage virion morphogenesis protein [Sphingomonas sanguinis]